MKAIEKHRLHQIKLLADGLAWQVRNCESRRIDFDLFCILAGIDIKEMLKYITGEGLKDYDDIDHEGPRYIDDAE